MFTPRVIAPRKAAWDEMLVRLRPWVIFSYALVVVIATVQRGFPPSRYPVFPIYRASSWHLLAGKDLYADYGLGDLFKYSPTFAFLFTPFAAAPFVASLFLWNLLNAAMLWRAVTRLLPEREATMVLGLLTPELFVSAQASQSNALIASFIILAFVAIEQGKSLKAAIPIALGAVTKIFPLAALSFGVFAVSRRRFGLLFACTLGFLLALPLVVVPVGTLFAEYRSWAVLEQSDLLAGGMSVMGLIARDVRGGTWPNWPVQLVGTVVLLLPVAVSRVAWNDPRFRKLFLCSLLCYVVLFNPQAERQSFIVAVSGVTIWYILGERGVLRTLILAFVLVGFGVVISVAAAWVIMQFDLLYSIHSRRHSEQPADAATTLSLFAPSEIT